MTFLHLFLNTMDSTNCLIDSGAFSAAQIDPAAAFLHSFDLLINDKREIVQFLSDFQTLLLPSASADVAKCYHVSRFQQITQPAHSLPQRWILVNTSDKASCWKTDHFGASMQHHTLTSFKTKQNSCLWYGQSIIAQQQRIAQHLNAALPASIKEH